MTTSIDNDASLQNTSTKEQLPINFSDLEKVAEEHLSVEAFGYIRSGAGGEETLRKNTSSFSKLSLVPRFLNDVSSIDPSITLFGHTYPQPIMLAPVGMQKLANEEAELASSQAAATFGIPFVQSTVSSYSIEDIKKVTGDSPKWFQLYWSQNENVSYSMVKRAEDAGYEAIVLTIDTVMPGWREQDMRNQFSPLKTGLGRANYETDEVFLNDLENQETETIIQAVVNNIPHPKLNWDNVAELQKRTKLPILLKGILHPEDALLAIERGIDGIIVSNHGGRQLDGVIASIEALPAIIDAVKGRIPVLLDSGIRRGSDVLKALSLGADAVLIGRPYVYALAEGGQDGVERLISTFIQEITVSMVLVGAKTVADLQKTMVVKDS